MVKPVREANPPSGPIVIVGAGLAGLFTALKLAPLPVTVIAAAPMGEGSSSIWAQGGVERSFDRGDVAPSGTLEGEPAAHDPRLVPLLLGADQHRTGQVQHVSIHGGHPRRSG